MRQHVSLWSVYLGSVLLIEYHAVEQMTLKGTEPAHMCETTTANRPLENLLRGIYAYGYESPSAVQSRAIVQICKGRDTIAQAQSGTGKTATFSISILQVIDTAVRETQGEPVRYEPEANGG